MPDILVEGSASPDGNGGINLSAQPVIIPTSTSTPLPLGPEVGWHIDLSIGNNSVDDLGGGNDSNNWQSNIKTKPQLIWDAQSQGVTIDNNWQATRHYLFGDGSAAHIGPKTTTSLLNSPEFLSTHKGIISGQTKSSGMFNINMTKRVFHIGRTNVGYSIAPGGKSVTYQLYINDGFWDPDFIDEKFLGPNSPYFKPDGMGPNLERFGGTPYPYIPTTITFPF